MEEKKFEVILTYQGKSVLVETNQYNTIEHFIEETKNQAREMPDELSFNMPEMDEGNNPVRYLLTRNKDGKTEEILKAQNRQKDNQTLADYGVVSGDELIMVSVPIGGANLM
jgi:hypothetical protein